MQFVFLMMILTTGCVTHKDIDKNSRKAKNNDLQLEVEEHTNSQTVATNVVPANKKQSDPLQLKLLQIDSSLRELRGQIEVLDKKYQDQHQELRQSLLALEQQAFQKEEEETPKDLPDSHNEKEDFFYTS